GRLQGHERLRRGAVLLPLAVVLIVRRRRPHPGRVEGEGGIPVGDRRLVAHALHLGDEIAGHRRAAHGGDARDAERGSRLLHAAVERHRGQGDQRRVHVRGERRRGQRRLTRHR
ncbi:MAG: hypothetical protein ACK55I_15330, partial [bacterium]